MEIISNSVNDTINLGKKIGRKAQRGDIICLFGQLGSGKTVLAKGIALGLGIAKEEVVSPSFVLIREYADSKLPLFHFDLYRLRASKDIALLGYEEYLYDDGVSVIEWADRLQCLLPGEYLRIELFVKSDVKRLFRVKAQGPRYRGILDKLCERR